MDSARSFGHEVKASAKGIPRSFRSAHKAFQKLPADLKLKPVFCEIRSATVEDLPQIAALAAKIWRVCYPEIISTEQIEFMLEWMYNLRTLRTELESGICFDQLFVADTLIGFASYGPEAGEMKLHKLYIDPDLQRHGYGSELLAHVELRTAKRGFRTLILGVNKRNTWAISVYEKNGFRIRIAVVNEIGNGFVMDDYIMEKDIVPESGVY
jgi:ribosomal protein S18 acetylase RimI-like enzyme